MKACALLLGWLVGWLVGWLAVTKEQNCYLNSTVLAYYLGSKLLTHWWSSGQWYTLALLSRLTPIQRSPRPVYSTYRRCLPKIPTQVVRVISAPNRRSKHLEMQLRVFMTPSLLNKYIYLWYIYTRTRLLVSSHSCLWIGVDSHSQRPTYR